ncbi:hypothetical protein WJX72_011249 [[Myrmecia] bisecta]|uniref:DNA polymerase epsilon catalytic subunit n=1 Tax=[Myrmecia] bisecta TaxID=41462 RepID=A0AAW1QST1_9CHLO
MGGPAFGGRGSGRPTSLGPRDGGGRGGGRGGRGGRGKKVLNNGNYFGKRGEAANAASAPADAKVDDNHKLEGELGFELFTEGPDRLGWLLNLKETTLEAQETGHVVSGLNCYFMCQDGSMFKAQLIYAPYFYLAVKGDLEMEVDSYLRRKYEIAIKDIEIVYREDLDLKNHLSGLQRKLLKVSFHNVQQLNDLKRDMAPVVRRNKNKSSTTDAYDAFGVQERATSVRLQDALDAIVDMREYDVPYHMRFEIDNDVRCGHWFTVKATGGKISMTQREDLLQRAEPRICAFDIETTKLPLQFPNAEYDQVFMISYMVDKQGYLIVNREVVSEDISDFEYTPKPEFPGPFVVFNELDEKATLRRWFDHMRQVKPAIYVTYNGDFFDWPFIDTRAEKHGMSLYEEISFTMNRTSHECLSRCAVHMDCMHWVNRDSYLPQGSRGLKAVTKAKLGFNPIEVHPEEMVKFAAEQPQSMASYSVSDAVSTYYLYMTYIHPFIFALTTVIPMPPDEVLRKGSGTLCELLLMVQAYKANVIAPNKHSAKLETMYKGHLLESETYIGGKVEALESGVFRSDLPIRFKCKPAAYQGLLDKLDEDLKYAIEVEAKAKVEDMENYKEVREEIRGQLEALRDVPNREETPLIYHLDVAAMYPNIILTNRLQPSAVVTDEDCAACDFNRPGKTCLRKMDWVWRGETYSATSAEYYSLKNQLQSESFPPAEEGGPARYYQDLPFEERGKLLKDRLKKYSQKVYKRVLDKPVHEKRAAGVCQRENDFYVGTVRSFRDRRYEYKGLNKKWKGKLEEAKASKNLIAAQEAEGMVVLYDSLQLAHKCILNSFYGYVMRKGARWYSMEMAGVVTYAGAQIIQRACRLVEQLGTPLELDTDGIWCCLPSSFPENFKFKSRMGKDVKVSYPCIMLNVMVAEHNTNDQYQDLVDPKTKTYATSSQMSIEFEVDGPYKAMILPASKEEGKLIKKRYAVFNEDGTLAELKGFELKRRGELKLIKVFQGEVFERFLDGDTLAECYDSVAEVANRWLDMLDTQGVDLGDEELIDYISESCTMSKALDEYEGRKSCAITTAKRLAQFLGDERIKDKGLNCNYLIAKRPDNLPTSERAIPVAIFSTEPSVARSFLRKWCGDAGTGREAHEVPDVRCLVDWDYYRERLSGTIQKIITIPAAMQRIPNPVPRVKHPDWLHKKVREKDEKFQQRKLDTFFAVLPKPAPDAHHLHDMDMEDLGAARRSALPAAAPRVARATTTRNGEAQERENAGDARNMPAGPPSEPQEDEADLGPAPDRKADPAGWLAHQKRKWRATAQKRKRRRLEVEKAKGNPGAAPPQAPKGAGVGAFFRQQAAAATHTHWQIVQFAPTAVPGTFKAWVLADSRLYAVDVRVPRTFFVDSVLPPTDPEVAEMGTRVVRVLPHGAQAHNVYQVVVEDASYREQINAWSSKLAERHVKGVYEERLPLALHAALQLGCVAVVNPAARSRPLSEGFDLSDLQMKTTLECPYLESEAGSALRHVALYQSLDAVRGRAVYAMHLPVENRALVVIVNPAASAAQDVTTTTTERSWREAHAADPSGAGEAPDVEFEVVYARTEPDAARTIHRSLLQLREHFKGPLVVVTEAPGGSAKLTHDIPLLADFPCCDIPAHTADSMYSALGWQQRAARTAVHRIALTAGWFKERIEIARYCHIPVGNMSGDWVLNTADAQFARCLRDADHLLWMVDPTLPDVFGKGDTDAAEEQMLEEHQSIEVVFPGAYRCVCVRLRLHHLAVNSIIQAALIGELEGAAVLDDQQGCGPAFRVLKQLVQNWLNDAANFSNMYADTLLRNLWRWLCSPAAGLSSPALQRTVVGLMRKVLAQLVADMRKLGAVVVAADTSSIILATGKRNLTAAVGYVDYLLDALKRRELFQWLDLAPETFWHTLLFRDHYNFLGIKAQVTRELQEQLATAPGALTQGVSGTALVTDMAEVDEQTLERPQFDFLWNIKDYLPVAIQDPFLAIVTEFVFLPWKHAMREQLDGASQGGSQAVADAKGAAEAQTAWLQAQMAPHFTQKLLRVVRDIQKHIGTLDEPTHHFPRLAGSHLSEAERGTAAEAFVRSVCCVLTLDQSVEEEVALLRRNLLTLLHMREFSDAAAFQEPCLSFVLRDVICTYCNNCRDLDLCRDPDLQAHKWACEVCANAYNLGAIEAQLIHTVQQRAQRYQLQDLRCMKCKQIASGHLRRQCHICSGHLANTVTRAAFHKGLTVFRNVARYHSFELLMEIVGWLLEEPSAHSH